MIGDGFETPIMYQDLANYSMPYMNMPYMMGQNSLIGGVRMAPQLDHDKVDIIKKKENSDKKVFKTALAAIGAMLAIGFIPTIRKGIARSGGVFNYIRSFFVRQPAPPSRMARFKAWCSNKWNSFKNLFRRNRTNPTPPANPPATPPATPPAPTP